MKFLPLLVAAVLAVPVHALAADAVKVDVYLPGNLKHTVSLLGANATYKLSSAASPNTTLELRLVAPEPVIIDLKETTTGEPAEAVGRVKLVSPGSSFAVSDIKGTKFHNAYVLVRPE